MCGPDTGTDTRTDGSARTGTDHDTEGDRDRAGDHAGRHAHGQGDTETGRPAPQGTRGRPTEGRDRSIGRSRHRDDDRLAGIAAPLEDDAWLEVRGIVEPDSARRDPELTPTFVVTGFDRIPAPDHPYERTR